MDVTERAWELVVSMVHAGDLRWSSREMLVESAWEMARMFEGTIPPMEAAPARRVESVTESLARTSGLPVMEHEAGDGR